LLLVLAILCSTAPAAPKVTVGLAQEWKTSFSFWLGSSGTAAKVNGWLTGATPTQQQQERQDERDIQVSRIQIYPGDGGWIRSAGCQPDDEPDYDCRLAV
jgi:hypothetical protein